MPTQRDRLTRPEVIVAWRSVLNDTDDHLVAVRASAAIDVLVWLANGHSRPSPYHPKWDIIARCEEALLYAIHPSPGG